MMFCTSLLCLGMLFTVCRGQQILSPPVNTAAFVGGTVQLNCHVELKNREVVKWTSYDDDKDDSNSEVLWACNVQRYSNARMEVKWNGNNYDLVINDLKFSDARRYSCGIYPNHDDKVESFAQLVVSTPPTCSGPSGATLKVGDTISLSCVAKVAGYKFPKLEWFMDKKRFEIEVQHYTFDENKGTVTATAEVKASGDMHQKPFKCELFFTEQVPDFKDSCRVHRNIIHKPQDVEISPDPDDHHGVLQMKIGQLVLCKASGYPSPHLHWQGPGDKTQDTGILQIHDKFFASRSSVTWICIAKSEIDGKVRTAQKEVTIKELVDGTTSAVTHPRNTYLPSTPRGIQIEPDPIVPIDPFAEGKTEPRREAQEKLLKVNSTWPKNLTAAAMNIPSDKSLADSKGKQADLKKAPNLKLVQRVSTGGFQNHIPHVNANDNHAKEVKEKGDGPRFNRYQNQWMRNTLISCMIIAIVLSVIIGLSVPHYRAHLRRGNSEIYPVTARQVAVAYVCAEGTGKKTAMYIRPAKK